MKRFLYGLVGSLLLTGSFAQAQNTSDTSGYQITATVAPFSNTQLYLGSYYGKYKTLTDSAITDAQGKAVFKGAKKLDKGIYFLVSPEKTILFEVLMDDKQHFSIDADTSNVDKVVFTGSEDNTSFQNYTRFLSEHVPQITALKTSLQSAKTRADSAKIEAQLQQQDAQLTSYRQNIMEKDPTSMLGFVFQNGKATRSAHFHQSQ